MSKELRCIHRHTIKTHPNCFKQRKLKEDWWKDSVIGYLDIETSNLAANFGMILSWCIKVKHSKHIRSAVITGKEIQSGIFDKRVVEELLKSLEDIDIIVTYYGSNFDIPYSRSRALFWGLDFPPYGSKYHWDLFYKARKLLRTNRKSLDVVTHFLGIDGKTHLDPAIWFSAQYGNKKSLEYILEHNKQDVIILEKLHERLGDYSKWIRTNL